MIIQRQIPCFAQDVDTNGSCLVDASSLLDVFGSWCFILANEVVARITSKPVREGCKLDAKTVDRLLVHVGLSDQFGQSN